MVKTILLPLDGSSLAERAIPYAATLARQSNAQVALVKAVQATTLPGVDPSEAQVRLVEQAEQMLAGAASRLNADGITTETHVYDDDPVHAILDAAERRQADLIVMSTHGRGGLGRMLYGSVADQVLRRATVPVLLVPSVVDHRWTSERPFSLLIPLDGSELAEEALLAADLLTRVFATRITLLRVVEPPTYPLYGDGFSYIPFDDDAERAEAQRYLDDKAAGLRAPRGHVETKVVVGEPARIIAATAREVQADLVVMATHGDGGLRRLILGSVASGILHQTGVPLLLIRPSAMHLADTDHEAQPVTDPGAARPVALTLGLPSLDGGVHVPLCPAELDLIDRGLKALAYAPGHNYGHVLAARALATRLKDATQAGVHQPVGSR